LTFNLQRPNPRPCLAVGVFIRCTGSWYLETATHHKS